MRYFSFLLVICLLFSGQAQASTEPGYVTKWDEFLTGYTRDGRVDYARLAENPAVLNQAFMAFGSVPAAEFESWTDHQKIAYWLNLYNLLAIQLVTKNYPIRPAGFSWQRLAYPKNSIQQIPRVWKRPVIKVRGQELSLEDIEHKILRKQFDEPRIHFALVCASLGCPVLRGAAYRADQLDRQLNEQVNAFLNNTDKFIYEPENRVLYLSPIFKWFQEDFESSGGIIAFLNRYRENEISSKANILWLNYDWNLNDIKK